jgi:hypothetical protein
MCRPYEESGIQGVEVASLTFDDLGVPAFLVNNASASGLWAGAKSFTEGFRNFERTLAECRASGGDIFSAVQDAGGQEASSTQGWGARWRQRLRRWALIGITGAIVFHRLR